MSDKPHTFDAKLEHLRLQKHVYDLVRVQNLSVKDVMKRNRVSNVKKITSVAVYVCLDCQMYDKRTM